MRCPRSDCNNGTFEVKELPIRGANYKFNALQCSMCGAVVTIVDWVNVGNAVAKIAAKLGIKL